MISSKRCAWPTVIPEKPLLLRCVCGEKGSGFVSHGGKRGDWGRAAYDVDVKLVCKRASGEGSATGPGQLTRGKERKAHVQYVGW